MTALRLLVAVDGSAHANGALRLVVALARRGARLRAVLLNVQRPVMVGEVGAIAPASVALEARDLAAAEVLEAASRVLAQAHVAHERLEEFEDPAAVAIAAVAAARGCDAIVVGSRGLGRLRGALLGSVSSEVIRRAGRPVIVLGTPDPVLPDGPLRILAALDGSEGSMRAIAFAADFADALPGTELQLLHVQQPLVLAEALLGPRERLIEHWSAADEGVFAGARALLESRGHRSSVRFAQDYAPAVAIARTAEELRCGLIVMGTRGLGPTTGLLLGSVAQGVLQRVRIPVALSH